MESSDSLDALDTPDSHDNGDDEEDNTSIVLTDRSAAIGVAFFLRFFSFPGLSRQFFY